MGNYWAMSSLGTCLLSLVSVESILLNRNRKTIVLWSVVWLLDNVIPPFRSNDGLALIVSSSDGFCSIVTFSPGEIGTPLTSENMPRFPSGTSVDPVTPVSIKKGTAEPKIKPRKIFLAPASLPSAAEANPHVETEAKTEMEVDESESDTEKKGKHPPSVSSTPTTSVGPKPRRVAFLTLCRGTEKSHPEAESCPDSSLSPASSEVKLTTGGTTSSPAPVVGSADTGVSSPQAALKPCRVDFVTLSESSDQQASVQGVPEGVDLSVSPAGLLGRKPGDAATNPPPPATQVTKSRRVEFITLSNINATKLPCTVAGTVAEASKDAANGNDKTVADQTEPMDVQIIP